MKSLGRAHAKVIVIGEHFVVPWTDGRGREYPGAAALAVPIPGLRTEVSLSLASGKTLECEPDFCLFSNDDKQEAHQVAALMEKATRLVASAIGWDLERIPLRVTSTSNFPISRGLGSSAAFAVALTRAFVGLKKQSKNLTYSINISTCQAIEDLFHGRSSGLDTAVILQDCPITYKNGAIQSEFHSRSVDYVVVDSGPRENCSSLVSQTIEHRRTHPERWLQLSDQVEDLVRSCHQGLASPDGGQAVAEAIRANHRILSEIGLVTPNVEQVIAKGLELGAWAGKVSGAGAGGAVLFVAEAGKGIDLAEKLKETGLSVLSHALP